MACASWIRAAGSCVALRSPWSPERITRSLARLAGTEAGVDAMVPAAVPFDPEDFAASGEGDLARQLDAGRRNVGRFIMSLGSPVTPATPVARVRCYAEIVRELSPFP